MIGARDPFGIRPLVLGRLDDAYILASETCALDMVGAKFVREVENGEIVVINEQGIESHRPLPQRPARPCIFEYIYFARPDSIIGGRNVYEVRKNDGSRSWPAKRPPMPTSSSQSPIQACPRPSAMPPASASPSSFGIIRNHYVGRTFIEPEQQIRALGVKLKHSANRAVIEGKRIVLIDDSVVRGTTSKKIVAMMRDAGAREVHMRIACPQITIRRLLRHRHARSATELLAAQMIDSRKCATSWAPTSLAFLSVDGLYKAMGYRRPRRSCPAIHRPLLHRRISNRSIRFERRRSHQPVLVPGRSHLISLSARRIPIAAHVWHLRPRAAHLSETLLQSTIATRAANVKPPDGAATTRPAASRRGNEPGDERYAILVDRPMTTVALGLNAVTATSPEINTGGNTGAYHTTFCPTLINQLNLLGKPSECVTSAGTGENLQRVARNPEELGYGQLDVFALEAERFGGRTRLRNHPLR